METTVIGRSSGIREVMGMVEKVANSDVTVLITGDSGTGKELIADAIFKGSLRADRPFLKMNCAAIPAELLESQMFGHERGAFTGAVTRQEGCFERADTGGLFLDEIGDMAMITQTKLLRVIQEKAFERIGGKETIKVDVRIIAATNKDLCEEIRKNRFREDLYYRLNVVEILIPPLRERMEDLPLLVEFFLASFRKKYGKEELAISPEAMSILNSYDWPGNVRELRNVIERSVVLTHGKTIEPIDFPDKIVGSGGGGSSFQAGERVMTLEEMERVYVRKILEHAGGNKLQAARLLDIDPKTLRTKLSSD